MRRSTGEVLHPFGFNAEPLKEQRQWRWSHFTQERATATEQPWVFDSVSRLQQLKCGNQKKIANTERLNHFSPIRLHIQCQTINPFKGKINEKISSNRCLITTLSLSHIIIPKYIKSTFKRLPNVTYHHISMHNHEHKRAKYMTGHVTILMSKIFKGSWHHFLNNLFSFFSQPTKQLFWFINC